MKKIDKIMCGILMLFVVVGLPGAYMMETHKPYTETPTLNRQYIGDITTVDGDKYNNCLIMDVTTYRGVNKIYYFAGEHRIREDLKSGFPIKVQWKYIYTNGYYRIRNVYQEASKDVIFN